MDVFSLLPFLLCLGGGAIEQMNWKPLNPEPHLPNMMKGSLSIMQTPGPGIRLDLSTIASTGMGEASSRPRPQVRATWGRVR
jgi:hypothetical protein